MEEIGPVAEAARAEEATVREVIASGVAVDAKEADAAGEIAAAAEATAAAVATAKGAAVAPSTASFRKCPSSKRR